MLDILRELQQYQQTALEEGIDCEIAMAYNSQTIPSLFVKLFYSVSGDIPQTYTMNTVFDGASTDATNKKKLSKVNSFLSTVTQTIAK